MEVNYIRHLTSFFEKAAMDDRLNTSHVSIYMALFQIWNVNRFKNPISVARSEIMRVSKVSAIATYHKVMKQLNEFGYIKYCPSYNPYKGSKVYLKEFKESKKGVQKLSKSKIKNRSGSDQAVDEEVEKSDTSDDQVVVPYINDINTTNSKQDKLTSSNQNIILKGDIPSGLDEVKIYFKEMDYSTLEAEKFFNYFQSNGWKVGGRTPMKDWKAAARNWILNSNNFKKEPKRNTLHATTDKNYSEPL